MDGSRLYAAEALLDPVRRKLVQHPSFTRSTGASPSDPDYHRQAEDLAKLESQLRILLRNLNSGAHRLSMRQGDLKNLPRELRYRERQSITDSGRNLSAVYRKATTLLALLHDTYGNFSAPDMMAARPT